MNIDKFEMDTAPFEKTLSLRLPSTAMMDDEAAEVLGEWNSPLVYAEHDKRNFYYDVTGRVPLRSQLTRVMTREEAVGLFASVADALLYGLEKGINPKFILLDSDLVFVSEESGSMRFICVPAVNHGLQAKPLRAYIKELIANMQYEPSENLDYVGKIINYLNQNKKLDPADFIDFLDSLEASGAPVAAPSVGFMAADSAVKPVAVDMPGDIPEIKLHKEKEKAAPVIPDFAPEPAKKMALEDIDLSAAFEPAHEVKPEAMADIPEISLDVAPKAKAAPPVIDPEPIPVSFASPQPYLIRKKNGERIPVDKDEFKIGKIPGMADYLLADNPAVSRMHAIIHKIDGSYYICDNYSTNSTFLNGEQLEPGKNYILLNGVRINFANDEFTYYMD